MTNKNVQSERTLRNMIADAFPDKSVSGIKELTEGLCNAAYLISFATGETAVLKVAPADSKGLLLNEEYMMETEVMAMKLVEKDGLVSVPKIYHADFSKRLCNGNYFFMETLEGNSYWSVKNQLSEEENRRLSFELGKIEKNIAHIKGENFGFLANKEKQYKHLYEFVKLLISNVLTDAENKSVVIGVDKNDILSLLEKDKKIFDAVIQPVLVHWDMWEGNIFIKDGCIIGIIDWERALWGEPLMDDRFREHNRNADFLKGFGQEDFSEEEMRRIYWYDVFLYLTMMTEGAYRGYEDDSQYQWVKPLFEKSWALLCE